MRIERYSDKIIINETPGCVWFFGLFFAIVGGLFVYGALGGFVDYGSQAIWMLALAFVFGTVGFVVGIRLIYHAPVTKIIINRSDDSVFITRFGLFVGQQNFYYFDEIEQFSLIEEKDDDGDSIWYLGLKLIDDEPLKISSQASHDELFVSNFVFQANEFMGKQLSACELILDWEDESDDEMS